MIEIDMRGEDEWATKENNFRVALAFTYLLWDGHGQRKHIRDERRRFRKEQYRRYL